jgi:hypothetical protein
MRARIVLVVGLLTLTGIGSDVLSACGDKFLMVGRGVRFQRAYAAIHPGSILIVLPSKAVKSAAVRDSRLHTALKMAGHRVEAVPQATLAGVLAGSRYDIILAEQADAAAIPDLLPPDASQPGIISVVENPSSGALAAAQRQFAAVLEAPQSLPQILKLLDDVMQARTQKVRASPSVSPANRRAGGR